MTNTIRPFHKSWPFMIQWQLQSLFDVYCQTLDLIVPIRVATESGWDSDLIQLKQYFNVVAIHLVMA